MDNIHHLKMVQHFRKKKKKISDERRHFDPTARYQFGVSVEFDEQFYCHEWTDCGEYTLNFIKQTWYICIYIKEWQEFNAIWCLFNKKLGR